MSSSLPSRGRVRAVIFDLDGTLVDSRLDYDAIRQDLALQPNEPILEAIAQRQAHEREWALGVVHQYEMQGAERATVMPGARELLQDLRAAGLKLGVFTRNTRWAAELSLKRSDLAVDMLIARDDTRPKPAPDGLLMMLSAWKIETTDALYVGDYLHDLEAGRRASIRTILFAPEPPDFEHQVETVITHLSQIHRYL